MKTKDPNFATFSLITELKRKSMAANFYNDVINIITCNVQKFFEKISLVYNVLKNAVIFDPNKMVSESSGVLQEKLKLMLTCLVKRKVLNSTHCD